MKNGSPEAVDPAPERTRGPRDSFLQDATWAGEPGSERWWEGAAHPGRRCRASPQPTAHCPSSGPLGAEFSRGSSGFYKCLEIQPGNYLEIFILLNVNLQRQQEKKEKQVHGTVNNFSPGNS